MAKLKIEIPNCPQCGLAARGTVEKLTACAEFEYADDGTIEYSGFTDPFWNEQKSVYDKSGRIELVCDDLHFWFSKMEEIETGSQVSAPSS
jgi:hypothetical protein